MHEIDQADNFKRMFCWQWRRGENPIAVFCSPTTKRVEAHQPEVVGSMVARSVIHEDYYSPLVGNTTFSAKRAWRTN
jgi:hypothetical protein